MASGNGNEAPSRLDRIERALELLIDDHIQFREEHKQLLTAQVLLTEAQTKLTESQKRTDDKLTLVEQKLAEMLEAQTALIQIVDDMIRNRPPQ